MKMKYAFLAEFLVTILPVEAFSKALKVRGILFLCFAVFATFPADGQDITIEPNVLVSGDSLIPYVEPMVAVNPTDPDHIAGVSMKISPDGIIIVAVISMDGGQSWRESPVHGCGFDPWVAFLPSGEILASCLAQGSGPDSVLLYQSGDGGFIWQRRAELPAENASYDHPTLVVDTTKSSRRGTAYLVTGQVVRSETGGASLVAPAVARITGEGTTFSAPARLQSTNVWSMVLSPVVLSNGNVGFGFVDYAVDARSAGAGVNLLNTPRVWWASSNDGGKTLSMPYLIAEIEEMTRWGHVAVDHSNGRFHDRLYAVVDDFREGAGGVFVYHSADQGETWSRPVRVSRPDSAQNVRRLPAIAVNSDGDVLAAWFDPVENRGADCWRLTASASLDGGVSFLPAVPVAEADSCNELPGNAVEVGSGQFDAGKRWPAGGDYFGLSAQPDGSFRALWADSRTGVFQLWSTKIRIRHHN